MVQEARDNLLSNLTQSELKQVLEGSCDDLIPIRFLNGICKQLMDTFQDELNDMLVSRMDPTQVCTVSGLCWKPDNSDIEQRASDIFLRKSAVKSCNTCKSSVDKIAAISKITEKGDVVKAFSTACQRAGFPKTKCDEFAQTYVAKFLHHIQAAPSEKTCQFFGRCDGLSRPLTVGPADTLECEFCEAMIHKVVVQFNNTSMKQQVKTVLQNICKKSGTWANECQQRIDDDFDTAYDELISLLDPVNVCTLSGICNSKQSLRTLPMAKLTPARSPAPRSTAMCTVCQDVAKVVQKAVNANFTQNQLINALDLVCDVLPVTSKKTCSDFVDKNVPQLIQMFNDRFTVDHICSESFKFCPAAPVPKPLLVKTEVKGANCGLCSTVVNYLIEKLKGNSSDAAILETLEEVCKVLPVDRQQCQNYIDVYGEYIISMIEQNLAADAICAAIGLCEPPARITKGSTCDECKIIASVIVEAINDDRSEASIKAALEKSCQLCPDVQGCTAFIDQNLDELFKILKEDVTADTICEALKLCGAQAPPARIAQDPVCEECEKIASVIVAHIDDDRSEQNIKAALEKTCQLCPDVKGCTAFIDQNFDALIKILREEVTADGICKALKLCGAQAPPARIAQDPVCEECEKIASVIVAHINDDRSEANIKAALEKTCQLCPDVKGCTAFIDQNFDALIKILREEVTADGICEALKLCGASAPPVRFGADPVCEECEKIAGVIVAHIDDDRSEQNIKAALEKTCQLCPDVKGCTAFIDQNFDQLIKILRENVTADSICKALKLCGAQAPSAHLGEDPVCEECEKIASVIVAHINDDRSEASIKAALEKTCKLCPDVKGCTAFIDQNFDALIKILREEVTAEGICKALKLCGAQAVCKECRRIGSVVAAVVNGPQSEKNIRAVFDDACRQSSNPESCSRFVNQNFRYLLRSLRDGLTMDNLCKSLKLCGGRVSAAVMAREPANICDECEKIASVIVAAINDEGAVDNIKAALEKSCQLCPDIDGCEKFIDQNIDVIVKSLRKIITADNICESLRLCGARVAAPVKPKTNVKGCGLCSEVVDYLIGELKDNSTDADVLEALERVCKVLPFDKAACQNIINVYGEYIITLIQQDVAPDQICKAIGLCAAAKPAPVEVEASDSCPMCKVLAGFVISELKDNKTDAAILATLEKGCTALPIDQTQCKNVVDTYGSMIVSMIQNDLTPDDICATLQLCTARRVKGQNCEICETIATFLVDELKDNKTDAAILDVLERVCNVLPVDAVSCRNTIDTYGGMIISLIQQDATPEEICSAIGLCSTRKPIAKVNSNFCNACQAITGFLIDELKDNQTDEAVITALEKVCKVVPIDKVQCQNYVDVYGSMVIEMIKNNLSAAEICASTGFCSSVTMQFTDNQVCPLCEIVVHLVEGQLQNNNTQKEIEVTLQKACSLMPENDQQQCRNMVDVYTGYIIGMLESLATAEQICQTLGLCPTPPTTPKCEVCLYITNFVESELSDNRTEAQILKLLDKACDVIPNVDVSQCKETINQYSDMIITLLVQSVPPRKICEEIKLCPLSNKPKVDSKVLAPAAADEQCALCKWLVTWVDDKIQDNRTEAVIIDELDKACDLLSDAGKCKDMVNDYVEMIVKMLVEYADPDTICKALKKCPSTQLRRDEPPCRYCKYVIDELRSDVQNTEVELKKKLDGICQVLPIDPTSCQAFVEQYADQIIRLILSDADPEKICEILGVCPKKIKAADTKCNFCKEVMQFVTNEVQDETTDEEIVALVSRACNYVPAINREDCLRMVEIEGLVIVRMIGESLDADAICGAIKYCPEKRNADKLTCTWCQYALHFIQEKLYDNSTQQKIREELEQMCTKLPAPEVSAECKEFVDTYGSSLEVIIAQDLDPSVICPAIHACPPRKPFGNPPRRSSTQRCHNCVSTLRSFRHNPSQICQGIAPQFAAKCVGASSVGLQIVNAFESDFKLCKYAKSCSKLSGSFSCNRGGCRHIL